MRRLLRRYIPSMFHRRLLLVVAAAAVVAGVLGGQTARLTFGEHHRASLKRVENALVETRLIETVRGEIRDRHGRVLARDEPAYDVMVDYRVISGEWADHQAMRDARRAHRRAWPELSPEQRETLVARTRRAYERQLEELWATLADLGGIERAEIERRRSRIVRRVHRVASYLRAAWQRQRTIELGEPVSLAEVNQPIAEQRQAHSILEDVDESSRLTVESFRAEAREDPALAVWRHVEIGRPKQRRYPHETLSVELDRAHLPAPLREEQSLRLDVAGVGLHVIGQLRGVMREDIEEPDGRPFDRQGDLGGYLDGDRIGRFGIERAMERRLRGKRGQAVHHLDTGRTQRTDPAPGRDVELTLDINLQARVQAIMAPELGLMRRQPWHGDDDAYEPDEPLRGAAVVLDVDSAEVLAAVSKPTIPLETLREDPGWMYRDPVARPFVNRAIAQPYEPGSTLKPMLLVAAVSAGVHAVDEPIYCDGHLNPNDPNHYRCWIFRRYNGTHGPLEGPEAIARSCNIYFFALGRDMGVSRISEWYGHFGVGSATGVGLLEESRGILPRESGANGHRQFDFRDATMMGIGQGPVEWTPIQAAHAYATLVREGDVLPPTIIKDAHRHEPRRAGGPAFHPLALQRAMQGLDEAVNTSYGTGDELNFPHSDAYESEPMFNVEGVRVLGKSGTAQAHPLRIDTTGDGRGDTVAQTGSHGWFVALAQPEGAARPTHVIVVVVEYGGSGSQVAGPIANQIIHALEREGYL